jgi:hypothetical protein
LSQIIIAVSLRAPQAVVWRPYDRFWIGLAAQKISASARPSAFLPAWD